MGNKCNYCGKTEKEENIFPVTVNGKNIFSCQNCLSKQTNIKTIGFEIPLKPQNVKANKIIEFYLKFNKPEAFANASYAKISYTYENDIPLKAWKTKVKTDMVAKALGISSDDVINNIKNNTLLEKECLELLRSIEFISEKEYNISV